MRARSARAALHAMALLVLPTGTTARAMDEVSRLEGQAETLHRAGQDAAALAAAERLVRLVEGDGAKTSTALANVAWYALFARRADEALAASNRALDLAPHNILASTNRAHALLFLGRADEARAVYLGHKGERVGRKRWEAVISQDFRELRARGLAHPQMADIEHALASAPDSSRARARRATTSPGEAEFEARDTCNALRMTCASDCFSETWPEDCRRRCKRQEDSCLDSFSQIIHGGAGR